MVVTVFFMYFVAMTEVYFVSMIKNDLELEGDAHKGGDMCNTSLGHSVELNQNQNKLDLVFLCAFLRLTSNGFNHRNCFNWTVDLNKGHKSSQQFN